jgi:hypothetical protein
MDVIYPVGMKGCKGIFTEIVKNPSVFGPPPPPPTHWFFPYATSFSIFRFNSMDDH